MEFIVEEIFLGLVSGYHRRRGRRRDSFRWILKNLFLGCILFLHLIIIFTLTYYF